MEEIVSDDKLEFTSVLAYPCYLQEFTEIGSKCSTGFIHKVVPMHPVSKVVMGTNKQKLGLQVFSQRLAFSPLEFINTGKLVVVLTHYVKG